MLKLAVMASGGGSNFQAILERIDSGDLQAKVVLMVSNNSKCGAMDKAKERGIEALHLPPSRFDVGKDYVQAILAALERVGADLVILAGYMKKIPREMVRVYANRILNIHPALLPGFGGKGMYGHFVHEAVLEMGAKVSGVTVHLVDEEYDRGAFLLQRAVEVKERDTPDTLAARVLKVEHDSYWRAIQLFAEGRVRIEGRRAILS